MNLFFFQIACHIFQLPALRDMYSVVVGVRWSLVVAWALAVGACTSEPEVGLGQVRAASIPSEGQGQDLQGQDLQGQDLQGTDPHGQDWRDVIWEGVSLSGVTYGNVAASDARVNRTALEVWTPLVIAKLGWRQRFPDHYCDWSPDRSTRTGCTAVNLSTAPSPLAGTTWLATFRRPGGTTFVRRIRIGFSTGHIGAVKRDTTYAMHPLDGDSPSAQCDVKRCENPQDCRQNCDLWLYDITFPDWPNDAGVPRAICPPRHAAMAFSGTWDDDGAFVSSTTEFTFGCTSGVIAKCTRWGYRPFGAASRLGDLIPTPMAPYHQACLRAASADYCGMRHSFTRNGTLIDIYDGAFVPSARSLFPDVTAVAWEAKFNPHGGVFVDHMRYQELAHIDGNDVSDVCPGRFTRRGVPVRPDDILCPNGGDVCLFSTVDDDGPEIRVDSARACAHSEQTAGKWLSRRCSDCVRQVHDYCSDPENKRGWDAACVARAAAVCTSTMAAHSECLAGPSLDKFDSGCTLAVCLDDEYADCCSPDGSWSSRCVARANAKCTGGQDSVPTLDGRPSQLGFCGRPIP
jgi:hypothetical protein